MHHDELTDIQETLFDRVRDIRATKGQEYATIEDTLADFKEVAEDTGTTPYQVWSTYVKKHLRAVDTFIREEGVKSEAIEDRILDVVTYHILLLGLIKDIDRERTKPVFGVATDSAQAGEQTRIQFENIDAAETPKMPEMGPTPSLHDILRSFVFEPVTTQNLDRMGKVLKANGYTGTLGFQPTDGVWGLVYNERIV